MRRPALLLLLIPLGIFIALATSIVRPVSSSDVRRIAEAAAKYSYVATGTTKTVYRGKTVTSEIRLFHRAPNMCRIEYLTPPLKGVVVGSDGSQMWRIDPAIGKEVVMESAGCTDPESRLDLLMKNYRIEAAGSGRVVGVPVYVMNVRDKSGRLQKRLHVDKKTFVVLQTEDFGGGRLISESKFDSIKYVESKPSLFQRPSGMMCTQGAGTAMPIGELSKAVGFQVRQPKYIPAGYKVDGYRLYDCPCGCGHKSAYIRYTNGMSSISIFETRKDSGCKMEGSCKAFGSCEMMTTSADGKSFIIIADLSSKELNKIADSLL